jgi:hypothetical protein
MRYGWGNQNQTYRTRSKAAIYGCPNAAPAEQEIEAAHALQAGARGRSAKGRGLIEP